MYLVDYEQTRIPEGHYSFQIKTDSEKRKHPGKNNKDFVSIKFFLRATNDSGQSFDHQESLLSFEDRYHDLLVALGAEEKDGRLSGSTIDPSGMIFQADIVYEADKTDPTKSWARLVNIKTADDIPF